MIIKYFCHTGRPTIIDHIRRINVDPRPEKFTLKELPKIVCDHFKAEHVMIVSTKLLMLSEKINSELTEYEKEGGIPSEKEEEIFNKLCCFDFIGIEYTDGHNEERILGPEPTIYIMNDQGKTIDKIRNGMNMNSAYKFYEIEEIELD